MAINKKEIQNGIHLYININNLNSLISKEEKHRSDLTRIFYAMDAFLSTIEDFIKRFNNGEEIVYVEKLTSSRIHLVFYKDEHVVSRFLETVYFANALVLRMKNNNSKFSQMDKFDLGMGADIGLFFEFEFADKDPKNEISESTSIGYPANRAAKLQAIAENGELVISKELLILLGSKYSSIFLTISQIRNQKLKIRDQNLDAFSLNTNWERLERTAIFDGKKNSSFAFFDEKTKSPFAEIDFTEARSQIDFSTLSLKQSKKIQGCVLYADIRGFSRKFTPNGGNLIPMSRLTIKSLKKMYFSVIKNNCVHIQFQGDRESGIANKNSDFSRDFALNCVVTAMKIVDEIKGLNADPEIVSALGGDKLAVGVGCSMGTIYATRIGVRGQKDNLILGQTVHDADIAEDQFAQENETVLTIPLYSYLVSSNTIEEENKRTIKKLFVKRGDYYVYTQGYATFRENVRIDLENGNSQKAREEGALKPWKF